MLRKKKDENSKDIIKDVLSVLPVRSYNDDLDCFNLSDDSKMDILHVIPRDIQNLADEEIQREMYNFIKLLRTVAEDIKFVSVNFPLNTSAQREILMQHRDKADDEVKQLWIDRQIDELERVDASTHTINFYLIFYGNNENEFLKHKDNLMKYACAGIDALCEPITKWEKIQIVTKLCNMNTTVDIHYFDEMVGDM